MGIWKIAWRSIQQRAFASGLTGLSMALGVMLVVAVINGYSVIQKTFDTNRSLSYNMIIAAKGGDQQIVFNTVYYLSRPVANIPYTFYEDFLSANQADVDVPLGFPRKKPGLYSDYVELAVPVCMGDYYKTFKVIGTSPDFFTELGPTWGSHFEFQSGRTFKKLEFFGAVMGSTVARENGLVVRNEKTSEPGSTFQITHGAESGEEHAEKFEVLGILAPTGTPVDRGVFVNMEGNYLLKSHSRTDKEPPRAPRIRALPAIFDTAHTLACSLGNPWGALPILAPLTAANRTELPAIAGSNGDLKPLPLAQREVTAVLLKTAPFGGRPETLVPELTKAVNSDPMGRAVAPMREIFELFDRFIDPISALLLIVTLMVVGVSGLSILVSIYNSMSDRQREIAVMRALGASRGKIMTIILCEALLISWAAGLLGWIGGHALLMLLRPVLAEKTGIVMPLLQFSPTYELILVAGLMALATAVGFLPALTAYKTDVSKALSAAP